MSLEDLDAALLWCKWPHIPDPNGVVHGIGQHIRAIRGQTEPCHCVIVATHAVQQTILAQVPHLGSKMHEKGIRRKLLITLPEPNKTTHWQMIEDGTSWWQDEQLTFMSLSIPPEMTCSEVSLKVTAVTWRQKNKLYSNKTILSRTTLQNLEKTNGDLQGPFTSNIHNSKTAQ